MTERITGFSALGELGFELTQSDEVEEEKDEFYYKSGDRREIVTIISYLFGMKDDKLELYYGKENGETLKKLYADKNATILRSLCGIRLEFFKHYKIIEQTLRFDLKNIDTIEYFDKKALKFLRDNGVEVYRANCTAQKYVESINELIDKNINPIKPLFPDYINFDYIRDLISIPKNGKKKDYVGEFNKYQANINLYPFQLYIHWNPQEKGNILISDDYFLTTIYSQHKAIFERHGQLKEASGNTKEYIYDYINDSQKIAVVVDCENADPYKLFAVFKSLDEKQVELVDKIILYDDSHTAPAWDYFEKMLPIPVEHYELERVTERKSLVDIGMTAGICKSYYKDEVDSFILCSSDSDYWGVITSLPEARFLVLYEYSKCGRDIKVALDSRKIFHCAMDDFYFDNSVSLRTMTLNKLLDEHLPDIVGTNGMELAETVFREAYIEASMEEIEAFYKKYIKTLQLKIGDDGVFHIERKS